MQYEIGLITGDSQFERYWTTYAFMQIKSTSSSDKALHTPWCLSMLVDDG